MAFGRQGTESGFQRDKRLEVQEQEDRTNHQFVFTQGCMSLFMGKSVLSFCKVYGMYREGFQRGILVPLGISHIRYAFKAWFVPAYFQFWEVRTQISAFGRQGPN